MSMIANLLRVTGSELDAYLNDSSLLESRLSEIESNADEQKLVDIDKSWEGIIFLLTGQRFATDHPLVRVLFSGQLIDEEQDLGYGPAHYLTSEEVVSINEEISALTGDWLKEGFDAERMMQLEVYPAIWKDDDAFEYLADGFSTLRQTYAEAAKNGEAVITFLS
jgi:hypothetical protein